MDYDWVWPTLPATVSALLAGLIYLHQRAQARDVSWELVPGAGGHFLQRSGGGTAYHVRVSLDEVEAIAYVAADLTEDEVGPGEGIPIGAFLPQSPDFRSQRFRVTWRTRRYLGRRKTRRYIVP